MGKLGGNSPNKKPKFRDLIIILLVGIIIFTSLYIYKKQNEPVYEDVKYTKFTEMVESGGVTKVYYNASSSKVVFDAGDEKLQTDNPRFSEFKKYLLTNDVDVVEESANFKNIMLELLFTVLRLGGIIIIFFFLMNRMGMSLFKKKESMVVDVPKIGLKSIAGNNESKAEMETLVDFLKSPKKYTKMGAKLPKGIVFYGPPGTGKTLTAKAIAGEAGVPFFSVSGSDFVEMYVGLGAKRVRELFADAKAKAPCIVFIDEIDAVGTRRGGRDGNSEKDQTINALLAELDGFNSNEAVIVIIATNRVEDLDSALVRPGRFDRHIAINLPDNTDREEILSLYARNKKLSKEVDLKKLSKITIGFSGAGLEALMNEAAIIAASKEHEEIVDEDIDDAYFKIIMKGSKKKNRENNVEDIELTAYHEAGHALAVKLLTDNDVPKVTIIPTTSGYGGATFNIPKKMGLLSRKEILNNIRVLYAGRCAEFILRQDQDEITTGAMQDIKQASEYINGYFKELGMSEKYGMINLSVIGGKDHEILNEAIALSSRLYKETMDVLMQNSDKLEAIAKELMEKETINEDDLNRVIFNI